MRIGFVMPAYNEELLLAETVTAVLPFVDRLVLVDDGSSDGTPRVAALIRDHHPDRLEVVRHGRNRGVGAAVVTGIRRLLEHGDVDAVGIIAADNQCDPALIPRFCEALEAGDGDVAKGSRFLHLDTLHLMPRLRFWGNRGVSAAMQIVLGYWSMSDILHGYLLGRADVFQAMDLGRIAEGYGLEITMMAEFRRLRCRLVLLASPSRYGRERSHIAYRREVPETLATMLGILLARIARARPVERAPLVLLTLGAAAGAWALVSGRRDVLLGSLGTLALAAVAIHLTTPSVTVRHNPP
jgi:glycosyltransferase involved in cell wall biosynthesis